MLVDMHSIIILLLSDRIITLLRSAKSNIRFPNRENFNKQDYASIFYLLILFSWLVEIVDCIFSSELERERTTSELQ